MNARTLSLMSTFSRLYATAYLKHCSPLPTPLVQHFACARRILRFCTGGYAGYYCVRRLRDTLDHALFILRDILSIYSTADRI